MVGLTHWANLFLDLKSEGASSGKVIHAIRMEGDQAQVVQHLYHHEFEREVAQFLEVIQKVVPPIRHWWKWRGIKTILKQACGYCLSMASWAAKLSAGIYDNNLPSHIQVFKSSHLSQCKWGVFPGEQMASGWCKSSSSEGRIKSSLHNSFGEVLQDLLQSRVMFHYLWVIEHDSAEGKKWDAGMAMAFRAGTSMSVPCHGVMGGSGCRSKCDVSPVALRWHRWKLNRNFVLHRKRLKVVLTKAESVFK